MKRREFIVTLGGAAVLPFAARAQQGAMPVVGFLRSTPLAGSAHLVTAFRQGLKEAGFAQPESRQIFIQAGANTNVIGGLLDNIYRRKGPGSLTCEQIRGLNVICDQCPDQFKINPREHISEIS